MRMSFFRLCGILVLGYAASKTTNAGTLLYNNLGDPLSADEQLTGAEYQSFSSGSSALLLDDLKLNLIQGAPDSLTFTVGLYSDASTAPSTLLLTIATVSDTTLTLSNAIYDFPVADFSLAANTQYWIGLIPVGGSINAKWATSVVAAGDTGTSGQHIKINGIVFPSNSNFAFNMSVDAVTASAPSSTPEPSSGLLLAAGLGIAWWARRSRVALLIK